MSDGIQATEESIDPDPSWWPRHSTSLRLERDGLVGGCISLQVVGRAFAGVPLTWYSLVYGDFADDFLAIATDTPLSVAHVRHEVELMRKACDEPFEEYVLTPEAIETLGIRFLEDHDYAIDRTALVRYQLALHDNCYFFVKPQEQELHRRIMRCVLRQHGYYLGGIEANWSPVVDPLLDMLAKYREVELKSLTHRHRIQITGYPGKRSWFKPPDPLGLIKVEDDTAVLVRPRGASR